MEIIVYAILSALVIQYLLIDNFLDPYKFLVSEAFGCLIVNKIDDLSFEIVVRVLFNNNKISVVYFLLLCIR